MTGITAVNQAKIIGERIRRKRKELGFSREVLSDSAGLAIGTIEKVETGRQYLNAEHILALCPVLEMSPNMLLTGNDEYDPSDQEEITLEAAAPMVMEMAASMNYLDAGTRRVLTGIVRELARARLPDSELRVFDATLAALKQVDYGEFTDTVEDIGEVIVGQIEGEVEGKGKRSKRK